MKSWQPASLDEVILISGFMNSEIEDRFKQFFEF